MSEFNQVSFRGGMNLLVDDTRLAPNEYRVGFNLRNRFDILDPIMTALDVLAPAGRKQGLYTFGDYVLLFCSGHAYYQLRDTTGWTRIPGFAMDANVVRFFVETVPVATTRYGRVASKATLPDASEVADVNGKINLVNFNATSADQPGVLVQDGINQPWFLFLDPSTGVVTARVTQKYSDWQYDSTGVDDRREYVPVGTVMAWQDGILHIVSKNRSTIYRSVSGRPLDFVLNVDLDGNKGGDAETTSYSVGVGNITCIRPLNSGGLFISASSVCFLVTPNRNPNAPTLFGEPTFVRTFLFNASCVNNHSFIDYLGNSAFIDPEGLRDFNAVLQLQNEGRNSVFSLKISALFKDILQESDTSCAIVFDNYALFGVNTIYGYVIVVYDTLNQCFSSIDLQTSGVAIRQFAKIETDIVQLYAITADDKVVKLYGGPTVAQATLRTSALTYSLLEKNENVNMQNPKVEIKLQQARCVLSGFRENSSVTLSAFVNQRLSVNQIRKEIPFVASSMPYTGEPAFPDVDSQVNAVTFSTPNCAQGWKLFLLLSWTGGGSITNLSAVMEDLAPEQSMRTQSAMQNGPYEYA